MNPVDIFADISPFGSNLDVLFASLDVHSSDSSDVVDASDSESTAFDRDDATSYDEATTSTDEAGACEEIEKSFKVDETSVAFEVQATEAENGIAAPVDKTFEEISPRQSEGTKHTSQILGNPGDLKRRSYQWSMKDFDPYFPDEGQKVVSNGVAEPLLKVFEHSFATVKSSNMAWHAEIDDDFDEQRKPHREWSMDDFEVGKELGAGGFGVVKLAREKKRNFIVAIKAVKIDEVKLKTMALREVKILRSLDHRNVLRLHGVFWDSENMFLVLDFEQEGAVLSKLLENGKFPETKAVKYVSGLAAALMHCHERFVLHRDVKPENMLIGVRDVIKLADFGCSINYSEEDDVSKECVGTDHYMAPEVLNGEKQTEKIDIWSLGVVLFEFLNGKTPYEEGESAEDIYQGRRWRKIDYPKDMPHGAVHLVKKILVEDPAVRPGLIDILSDYWFAVNAPLRA